MSICLFPCLGMLGMIGMFILSIFIPPTKFLCLHSHVKVMFNITCVTQCACDTVCVDVNCDYQCILYESSEGLIFYAPIYRVCQYPVLP